MTRPTLILAALALLSLTACNRAEAYSKCDPDAPCYVNGELVHEGARR